MRIRNSFYYDDCTSNQPWPADCSRQICRPAVMTGSLQDPLSHNRIFHCHQTYMHCPLDCFIFFIVIVIPSTMVVPSIIKLDKKLSNMWFFSNIISKNTKSLTSNESFATEDFSIITMTMKRDECYKLWNWLSNSDQTMPANLCHTCVYQSSVGLQDYSYLLFLTTYNVIFPSSLYT